MRVEDLSQEASMIVIMGITGAGKSHFINQLAGREIVEEGSSLKSCTQACSLAPVEIGKSKVLLIDTPGFDDTKRTDAEILEEIARVLAAQYELGVALKGIVYMHRITDIRVSGSSLKTFEIFKRICGEDAFENVLLVTSRWSEVAPGIGSERERELKEDFWAYMLARGSKMSRFHGDRESAISLVSQLLQKMTVTLELQKELVQGKRLDETTAGAFVSDDLEKLKRDQEEQLAKLHENLRKENQGNLDMIAAYKKDLNKREDQLRLMNEQLTTLQQPIGQQVQQEVASKKSKFKDSVPFMALIVQIISAICNIPAGTFN